MNDDVSLTDPLFQAPGKFDFFQAIRLLEREVAKSARSGRISAIGTDADPKQESIRFTATPTRQFAGNEIARISKRPDDGTNTEKTEVSVTFMGLTGPAGVLPHFYSSLLLLRQRERDYVLRDFLDVFHHRTISLFYRAWEKYRFAFNYEHAHYDENHDDHFTDCLVSLTGCETIPQAERSELPAETFQFFAGMFTSQQRTAVGLERILADYFSAPIEIRQFDGQWQTLSADDRTCLPRSGRNGAEGQYCRLGMDAFIGERIWDVQGRFRVRIGPIDYATFRDFLPTGKASARVSQLTRCYVGTEFDFVVQLVLEADDVPQCQLGSFGGNGAHLGWDTWIRSQDFDTNVDDAVFTVGEN